MCADMDKGSPQNACLPVDTPKAVRPVETSAMAQHQQDEEGHPDCPPSLPPRVVRPVETSLMAQHQQGEDGCPACPPPLPPRQPQCLMSTSVRVVTPSGPSSYTTPAHVTTSTLEPNVFLYSQNSQDAPRSLTSAVTAPHLRSTSRPDQELTTKVANLELHTKEPRNQPPVSKARCGSNTEWFVNPRGESPLHPAPMMALSEMEQQGFLDMWHFRKYKVVWATFDGKTLFIFKNKEDLFSMLFLTASSIKVVMEKDESKFSVSTNRKELVFRAHSREEQDKWLHVLCQAARCQQADPPLFHSERILKSGTLALKGLQSKVFVVVTKDQTLIFSSKEDFTDGFGVLSIEMNIMPTVKKGGQRTLEVITPKRTFSFTAGSKDEAEEWVTIMSKVANESLCTDEVAKRIWSLPENQLCADCGSPQPDWVSVNLVVVICQHCAGQHRSLGTRISNIKSMKLDSTIWTDSLIELFLRVGNKGANEIWACNIPPSACIDINSLAEDRHRFIYAKYKEGMFRKFHPLFGKQEELNEALRKAILSDDNISETMLLVSSGADVMYHTDQPDTPIILAEKAGQELQLEYLKQNVHKDTPSIDLLEPLAQSLPENFGKKELLKRKSQAQMLLQIHDNMLCFHHNHSQERTDSVELHKIISVARCPMGNVLEIGTPTGGYRCEAGTKDKVAVMYRFVAQALLTEKNYDANMVEKSERMTQVRILDDGYEEREDAWILQGQNDMMILGAMVRETCAFSSIQDISYEIEERLLSIQTTNRYWQLEFLSMPEFEHWCSFLCDITTPISDNKGKVQSTNERGISPAMVHYLLQYLNQHGLETDGIYRHCAIKSRIENLVTALKRQPAEPTVKLNKYMIHEVAGAFKQLLREMNLSDLFTEEYIDQLIQATKVEDENDRVTSYTTLLNFIPINNKLLLKAIFGHLHSVHRQSSVNQMTARNLSMIFASTLFQGEQEVNLNMCLLYNLITHYQDIFNVH